MISNKNNGKYWKHLDCCLDRTRSKLTNWRIGYIFMIKSTEIMYVDYIYLRQNNLLLN